MTRFISMYKEGFIMRKLTAPFLMLLMVFPLGASALAEDLTPIEQNAGMLQFYFPNQDGQTYLGQKHGESGCSLIVLPTGETILVDASLESSGREILPGWLKSLGVGDHIDYFIATHHHNDHIAGFAPLAEVFTFGKVYGANWSPEMGNANQAPSYFKKLEALGMKEERLRAGDVLEFGDVRIRVFWPTADSDLTVDEQMEAWATEDPLLESGYPDPWHPKSLGRLQNNHSLVFQVQYGSFTALYTGDIEYYGEERMLALCEEGELESDLMVMPHHGISGPTNPTSTSGSEALMDAVLPYVTIVPNQGFWGTLWEHLRVYSVYSYSAGYHDSFTLVTNGDTMTFWTGVTEPITEPTK